MGAWGRLLVMMQVLAALAAPGAAVAGAVVRSLGQDSDGKQERLVVRSYDDTGTMVAHDCALAEGGDAAAAYRLGRRYLFGMGVSRDRRMGFSWIAASASRGYAAAVRLRAQVPRSIGRVRPWCRDNLEPVRPIIEPETDIVGMVERLAPEYGLDPRLVLAVIQVESAYRTDAVSSKEAAGLMQLIPATAARFGVQDVFDPTENVRGGMAYLRWLLAYFRGDVSLTLAAYNAGEGAVDRHRGVPPYAETRAYLKLVRRLYPDTAHRYDPSAATPSAVFFH
ncbi:MAG: transglycosylase SLT domain-containing protein [Rhodospirillaceae bacterium]